jgi:hypothetical protein
VRSTLARDGQSPRLAFPTLRLRCYRRALRAA